MIPPYGDNALNGHAWVPIDDENCMSWCFTHHPTRPLTEHELDVMRNGGGIHVKLIPGSFRPVVNKDNDYMIDRAAQKAEQDLLRRRRHRHAGCRDPGKHGADPGPRQGEPGLDRQRRDHGAHPVAQGGARRGAGPASPTASIRRRQAVRSASIVLPENVSFYEAAADALKAKEGVAHASV